MEPDVDSFLLLFNRFSYSQRTEAIRRLNEYIEGGQLTKDRIIKESGQRNTAREWT